jgi:hypothetical protein
MNLSLDSYKIETLPAVMGIDLICLQTDWAYPEKIWPR